MINDVVNSATTNDVVSSATTNDVVNSIINSVINSIISVINGNNEKSRQAMQTGTSRPPGTWYICKAMWPIRATTYQSACSI